MNHLEPKKEILFNKTENERKRVTEIQEIGQIEIRDNSHDKGFYFAGDVPSDKENKNENEELGNEKENFENDGNNIFSLHRNALNSNSKYKNLSDIQRFSRSFRDITTSEQLNSAVKN